MSAVEQEHHKPVIESVGNLLRVDGIVVKLAPKTGYLSCGNSFCNGELFCSHISAVIQQHEDYSLLGPPDSELTGVRVMVPLVPVHEIWTEVRIGDLHNPTNAYRLWLCKTTSGQPEVALGFLQQGEGRAVIRSMVYSWFMSTVSISLLSCPDGRHSYKQELAWRKNIGPDSNAGQQLAEFWSVWAEGRCLTCNSSVMIFDDLVPDASSNSSGMWR